MDKLTARCAACGTRLGFSPALRGQRRTCPKCGATLTLEAEGEAGPAAVPPQPAPAGAEPAGGTVFPERMKANRALAGKACPGCSKEIELGDDVWNCQSCRSTMHQSCRESANGCANPQCPTFAGAYALAPQAAAISPAAAAAPAGDAGDLVECRFCGEKIKARARKCRFCGEFQSAGDRRVRKRRGAAAAGDDNLTAAEIVFGIICSGIACIVGLVWMIQGKKKGGKLFLIALITSIIATVIQLAAKGNLEP